MSHLVWLIPLFPLLGAAINAVGGGVTGHRAHWIANSALAASFVVSCAVFARVWNGETWSGELFPWIQAGPFNVAVGAQVDQLTAVMLLVVTGVGFLIHVYSIGYMHGDDGDHEDDGNGEQDEPGCEASARHGPHHTKRVSPPCRECASTRP